MRVSSSCLRIPEKLRGIIATRKKPYLVLLHDPKPHPFLCIEEPENQLYPRLRATQRSIEESMRQPK